MKEHKINYGKLIDPEKWYPVSYTIKQDGTKVRVNANILGSHLTENQIKEIIDRSDSEIVVKHGGKRKGSGRPKKAKTTTIRVPTKYVKAIKEWLRASTEQGETWKFGE